LWIPGLTAEVARRVDHHGTDAVLLDLAGHALRLEEGLLAEQADVAAAVADQDQQRVPPWVAKPLGFDQLQRGHQTVRERGRAPDIQPLQPALGQVDAGCWA